VAQESAESTGTPLPLKVTLVVEPPEELLASVSWPALEPAAVGPNCTVKLAVWLVFSVNGKVCPETE
jgi:hypothetical protein